MKHPYCALIVCAASSLLLPACMSGPDRFYRLQPVPTPTAHTRQEFVAETSLLLSIPSMVDRSQIVLEEGTGIVLLEHERWAAPLIDQLRVVLGQDLEQRRPEILITSRPLSQAAGVPRYAVQVEIVGLLLRKGAIAQIEVRWRIEAPGGGMPRIGRETISAAPGNSTPAALAVALSECVAQLADHLAPLISPV